MIYFALKSLLYPEKWRFNFHSSYILFLGAPSIELLDSPATAMDHPFLKAFQTSSSSSPLTDGNEIKLTNILGGSKKECRLIHFLDLFSSVLPQFGYHFIFKLASY